MSDNLKENEWKILKDAKIWPKDKLVNSQSNKFIARELYVPSTLHSEFCLPIIEWTEKCDQNTEEGIHIINLLFMNNSKYG